jgi:hypothetical protein
MKAWQTRKITGIRVKSETWVVPNNERVTLLTICVVTLGSWRSSASVAPYIEKVSHIVSVSWTEGNSTISLNYSVISFVSLSLTPFISFPLVSFRILNIRLILQASHFVPTPAICVRENHYDVTHIHSHITHTNILIFSQSQSTSYFI